MKHAKGATMSLTTDGIETYRIGNESGRWTSRTTLTLPKLPRLKMRGRPDRWLRTWQAEWDGCKRAPRAWTERGVLRKARRWRSVVADTTERA